MYSGFAPRDNQEEFIKRHAPLVKRIAYHLAARLPPAVLVDDLIQAGMLGLLDASRHYDASQGASFETYAGIRIRGAMLDELRKNDWVPKSVHRKARDIMAAVRQIENQVGRDARDEEIARVLGIGLDEYHKLLQETTGTRIFSIEDFGPDQENLVDQFADGAAGPLDRLEQDDLKKIVGEAIARLPEREKLVVTLYYVSELNLREIGEVLGVTESRISQLLSQALLRLRVRLDY